MQQLGTSDAGLIVLTLKNGVPPGSNLSSESLKALIRNLHEQDPSLQTRHDQQHAPRIDLKKSPLGTQAGFPHIVLACRGAQGSCDLNTSDEGNSVILTMTLPARLLPATTTTTTTTLLSKRGEHGRIEAPTEPEMISGPEDETVEETDLPDEMPKGCKVIAIDDSVMLCKAYERIVLPKLGADMARSMVIQPSSQKCVDDFVGDALGAVTDGSLGASAHADVVILDQNIEFMKSGANQVVFGTDLATKLRSCGFLGLIVVRSANVETSDIEEYMKDGAVDVCLGKVGSNQMVAENIKKAFIAKQSSSSSSFSFSSSSFLISSNRRRQGMAEENVDVSSTTRQQDCAQAEQERGASLLPSSVYPSVSATQILRSDPYPAASESAITVRGGGGFEEQATVGASGCDGSNGCTGGFSPHPGHRSMVAAREGESGLAEASTTFIHGGEDAVVEERGARRVGPLVVARKLRRVTGAGGDISGARVSVADLTTQPENGNDQAAATQSTCADRDE